MVFRIASSPYTHNQRQTSRIMLLVLIAALPGIAAQTWFFGWGTLFQIVLAAITALVAEAIVLRLRKQSVASHLQDYSALLTGLLLAVSIPPLAPWWMVVLGTGFAIIIAKQLYGGLGQNPFNPAMIGYVVLLISFPVQMTSWLPPYEIAATTPDILDTLRMIFSGHTASGGDMTLLRIGIDGISQATPLDTFKTSLRAGHSVEQIMQYPIYSGALAGVGWQWVNLAWLVGGVFLLWQKAIRMVLCSGAFLILPLGAKFANDAGIVSVNWLIASYGLQSIGELMISGLGLAMVAQLVPQRLMGFIMGSWFLTTAGANIIGGYVANLMAVPSDVTDPLMSLEVYGRVFMQIGIATAVIAVLMLLTAPKLNRMTQDDDTAEKGSKAATV